MTDRTDDLSARLKVGGHKLTSPRLAVWRVLVGSDGHMTVEEISDAVQSADPTVNISSIYRTLSLFEELGLARESKLGEGTAAHWELAHPDEQFHLRCVSCGRVQHHSGSLVAQIADHLESHHDFEPQSVELVVSGLCDRCQVGRS